jgi:hypothetical protein
MALEWKSTEVQLIFPTEVFVNNLMLIIPTGFYVHSQPCEGSTKLAASVSLSVCTHIKCRI